MKRLFVFLLGWLVIGCRTPAPPTTVTPNKFSDETLRAIYTAQDERKTTVLLPYLTHAAARYRQEAALALASVQDSLAVTPLTRLLPDPAPAVRRAAAYALGQIGKTAAEAALLAAAEPETDPATRAEILEALGKCATQKGLDALVRLKITEPTAEAGQAWGIYRTHARQLNYDQAVPQAVAFLTSPNPEVRLAAAHFLARPPQLNLTPHAEALITTAQLDPSAEVRIAATQALGKIKSPPLTDALIGIRQTDPDYRVQLQAVRALGNQDYAAVKAEIWRAVRAKNIPVALTAAELVLAHAVTDEAADLLQRAELTTNWRVRALLLAAVMKVHPDKKLSFATIQKQYQNTNNPYEKAALLTAIAQDMAGAAFVEQEIFAANPPVVRTTGLEALGQLRRSKAFPASQRPHFAEIFRRAVATGDLALVGVAAGIIRDPDLDFKQEYPDRRFLETALAKLVLPRDAETYQELQQTIAFLTGKKAPPPPQIPFSHPINWQLVQNIPVHQTAAIQTKRGNITLQLFVEDAPGTVANFVELAQSGFFDGKSFHRVVPNFVVQGGDPRGDGWGGTDYALRSEFANLRYREGYVGMASAGKDTESCQWFITHSPTPHLDGRYTIFARVTQGLDVLHLLEVGDRIERINVK